MPDSTSSVFEFCHPLTCFLQPCSTVLPEWLRGEGEKLGTRLVVTSQPSHRLHLLVRHLPVAKDNILPGGGKVLVVHPTTGNQGQTQFSTQRRLPHFLHPVVGLLSPFYLKIARLSKSQSIYVKVIKGWWWDTVFIS